MKNGPTRLDEVLGQLQPSRRDASIMNLSRNVTLKGLEEFGVPLHTASGKETSENRVAQGYQKDHHIDAACIGESGADVHIPWNLAPLHIKALSVEEVGRCHMDKYGFPRTKPKRKTKRVDGFAHGDMVLCRIPMIQNCEKGLVLRISCSTHGFVADYS